MQIEEIKIISKETSVLASCGDVDDLESRLWISLPIGYREYVTRIGEGIMGGFIRMYPPWRIEADLNEWRRRINKYWFWDAGEKLLPKDRALESIIIGDTVNGDELAFHPMRPNQVFVLPRHDEMIFDAGKDILSAIDWICSSGKIVEPFKMRDFEPFDSRKQCSPAGDSALDPEGESLDDIIELARKWAKRHVARNTAENRLSEQVGSNRKADLLYESILIDGPTFFEPGYSISWRITNKKDGAEHGIFYYFISEDSQSYRFAPAKSDSM
jgi:hypothetical protein